MLTLPISRSEVYKEKVPGGEPDRCNMNCTIDFLMIFHITSVIIVRSVCFFDEIFENMMFERIVTFENYLNLSIAVDRTHSNSFFNDIRPLSTREISTYITYEECCFQFRIFTFEERASSLVVSNRAFSCTSGAQNSQVGDQDERLGT